MAPPLVQRAAILGLGLMGGSLGLALREHGAAASVIGYDAAVGVAEAALGAGAVDEMARSVAACVTGADLVVLATPVVAMRPLMAEMAPYLSSGTLVTDLGSTKVEVMQWAADMRPRGVTFIGGHPMCGSERSGIEAATAAIFHGAVWCLTPQPTGGDTRTASLALLIQRLGALPRVVEAARHDQAMARVSHLPLVVAAALMRTVTAHEDAAFALSLAAGGLRDTTRVASGSPIMARDICLTNASALTAALDVHIALLQDLRAQIAAGDDPALLAHFDEARAARVAWLDGRGAGS
jgi:prephenate dehydrogenase